MREWKNSRLVILSVLGVLIFCGTGWASLSDGLIAHWEFEESSGSIAYDSASNNHGTIYGAEWTAGQIDGALSFDGIDDYVETALEIDQTGSTDLTMSAWVYPTSLKEGIQQIISTDNGGHDWSLFIRDGKWQVFTGYYSMTSEFNIDLNAWQHVVAVFDVGDAKIRFYKNGVISSVTSELFTDTSTNHLCIGDNPGWWHEYFEGKIDEVRIYNRALSAEEVEQLYRGDLVGLEIVGPNEVAEGFAAQYRAIAYYDNGYTGDVTGLAEWSVEPNDNCSIAAGLLTTEMIDLPEDITITADYNESGDVEVTQKQVSIFAICPSGSALNFDGSDDYVKADIGSTSGTITYSFWFKSNNVSVTKRIVTRDWSNGGSFTTAHIAGRIEAIMRLSNGAAGVHLYSGPLSSDTWYHTACVFDGTDVALYINGTLEDTGGQASILPDSQHLWIGARNYDFSGMIDDVRIYDRALSGEEIWEIMHTRPVGGDTNLVGYWDFDEGEGQVAGDSSVYGNDGQLGSGPGDDDNDPNWVDSDAPVGICTLDGLVGRNISNVLDIKTEILDLLGIALGKEDALLDYMDEAFHNGELDDLNSGDVAKAKQKIHSAIQHEEQAGTAVDQSIEKLEDALEALD